MSGNSLKATHFVSLNYKICFPSHSRFKPPTEDRALSWFQVPKGALKSGALHKAVVVYKGLGDHHNVEIMMWNQPKSRITVDRAHLPFIHTVLICPMKAKKNSPDLTSTAHWGFVTSCIHQSMRDGGEKTS